MPDHPSRHIRQRHWVLRGCGSSSKEKGKEKRSAQKKEIERERASRIRRALCLPAKHPYPARSSSAGVKPRRTRQESSLAIGSDLVTRAADEAVNATSRDRRSSLATATEHLAAFGAKVRPRVENFARLSVSDRGSGIPEGQIKRGLRAVFHQQSGRHGHGTVHRADHYRGAPRADIGQKIGITVARRSGSGFL